MTPPTEQNGEAGLREKVRERLAEIIRGVVDEASDPAYYRLTDAERKSLRRNLASTALETITREFRIQPVASGTVGEGGEVRLG